MLLQHEGRSGFFSPRVGAGGRLALGSDVPAPSPSSSLLGANHNAFVLATSAYPGYVVTHADRNGKVIDSTKVEKDGSYPGELAASITDSDLLLFTLTDSAVPNLVAKRLFAALLPTAHSQPRRRPVGAD